MGKKEKDYYERIITIKETDDVLGQKHHLKIDPIKKEVTCCKMRVADGKIYRKLIRTVRCSEMDEWDPTIGIALAILKTDIADDAMEGVLVLGGKKSTGSWRKFKEWAQDGRWTDVFKEKPVPIKEEGT